MQLSQLAGQVELGPGGGREEGEGGGGLGRGVAGYWRVVAAVRQWESCLMPNVHSLVYDTYTASGG